MIASLWENIFSSTGKDKTIRRALRDNILFQDLSFAEILLLEKIVNVRTYRPGESIFHQGEIGVGMYLVVSGSINIFIEELDPKSNEIKQFSVTQLKAADFFGELALVEREGRRTASATAQDETTLIGFFKPDLMELVERNPTAGVKILLRLGEVLGTRLHQTTSHITSKKKEVRP